MRGSQCDNCGALASTSPRCRYCGATVRTEDLVAAGFGAGDGAFCVLPDVSGVEMRVLGTNALRVEVPPETEVGPSVVGCAWTRGDFVDLDLSAVIRFERAAEGIAAGMWLRSTKTSGVCLMLAPDGRLTATVSRDGGHAVTTLGALGAAASFRPLAPVVLRAKIVGDVLTIHRDGVATMSVRCPVDLAGSAHFVVEVPLRERGAVVFEDACARLP